MLATTHSPPPTTAKPCTGCGCEVHSTPRGYTRLRAFDLRAPDQVAS